MSNEKVCHKVSTKFGRHAATFADVPLSPLLCPLRLIPRSKVNAYATFLNARFGKNVREREWDGTKVEREQTGEPWIGRTRFKACLLHLEQCKLAPRHVQLRVTEIITSLSKPGKLVPWKLKEVNLYCEWCRPSETQGDVAVLADTQEEDPPF